jgi:hypothetical protein
LAVELREAVSNPDLASTDGLTGYIGDAPSCTAFQSWTPHEAHHLAYSMVLAGTGNVVVAVRVFDLYAAAVVVSREAGRYFRTSADLSKLRFLAIDSVSGKTVDTAFDEENRRMAIAMLTASRKLPPYPDPL